MGQHVGPEAGNLTDRCGVSLGGPATDDEK
jgi:hypothetical protein